MVSRGTRKEKRKVSGLQAGSAGRGRRLAGDSEGALGAACVASLRGLTPAWASPPRGRDCSHGEAQSKVLWWPGGQGQHRPPGGVQSPSASEASSAPRRPHQQLLPAGGRTPAPSRLPVPPGTLSPLEKHLWRSKPAQRRAR